MMTSEQSAHLEELLRTFRDLASAKYKAGQREHGGNLWDKPVLPMLIEECLDLPIYALTLQNQIKTAIELLELGMAREALNILKTGNQLGVAMSDKAQKEPG